MFQPPLHVSREKYELKTFNFFQLIYNFRELYKAVNTISLYVRFTNADGLGDSLNCEPFICNLDFCSRDIR